LPLESRYTEEDEAKLAGEAFQLPAIIRRALPIFPFELCRLVAWYCAPDPSEYIRSRAALDAKSAEIHNAADEFSATMVRLSAEAEALREACILQGTAFLENCEQELNDDEPIDSDVFAHIADHRAESIARLANKTPEELRVQNARAKGERGKAKPKPKKAEASARVAPPASVPVAPASASVVPPAKRQRLV
jgi:hypothetical protein